jgi:hypothetical protein
MRGARRGFVGKVGERGYFEDVTIEVRTIVK